MRTFEVVHTVGRMLSRVGSWLWAKLAPVADGVAVGIALDAVRPRRELLRENALLRHQLVVLRRKVPRARLMSLDRLRLILCAAVLPGWQRVVAIVRPETVLRWHRDGFRKIWRRKSHSAGVDRRLAAETVTLIRAMAAENRTWGAERIRGELLKLGIRVGKRTVQKYIRGVQRTPGGQRWSTFLRNHADVIWCCDFVQTYDALFRPVFAFFIVHLASRRVVHVAVTRSPTQQWTAQQLRNGTMDGEVPKFLIRDRDDKFGAVFDRVAQGTGMRVIKTAVRAPNMNAVVERFLRSVRAEVLDHVLVLDDRHLERVLREYVSFFNGARPHQGLGQRVPGGSTAPTSGAKVTAFPVLGGLHHDYRWAA
jgi:putative transposase